MYYKTHGKSLEVFTAWSWVLKHLPFHYLIIDHCPLFIIVFHMTFFSCLTWNISVLDNYIIWQHLWCIKKFREKVLPNLLDTLYALQILLMLLKCLLKFIELICWLLLAMFQYPSVRSTTYLKGAQNMKTLILLLKTLFIVSFRNIKNYFVTSGLMYDVNVLYYCTVF